MTVDHARCSGALACAAALAVLGRAGGSTPSTARLRRRAVPHHSVSGFSAGGSAAMTHLVSHSSLVTGAAIVGGSPFACNTLPDPANTCSGWRHGVHEENTSIPWKEYVTSCISYAHEREREGLIDKLANLKNKKVLLFSGKNDVAVYQSVMQAVADQLRRLHCSVTTQFGTEAGHSWVVDSGTCTNAGVPGKGGSSCCGVDSKTMCPLPPHDAPIPAGGCCGVCNAGSTGDKTRPGGKPTWKPDINNCEYDIAGHLLKLTYGAGNVKRRAPQDEITSESLVRFKQTKYIPSGYTAATARLDTDGFLYVPTACRGSAQAVAKCKVHVDYHGCSGSFRDVSTSYMVGNGLATYAETNHIIIVFPQSASSNNPIGKGCFDWSGSTGPKFDTHEGAQIGCVMAVLADLAGIIEGATAGAGSSSSLDVSTAKSRR